MFTAAQTIRAEHYRRAQTDSVLAFQQCNVFIAVILLFVSHFKTSHHMIRSLRYREQLFYLFTNKNIIPHFTAICKECVKKIYELSELRAINCTGLLEMLRLRGITHKTCRICQGNKARVICRRSRIYRAL